MTAVIVMVILLLARAVEANCPNKCSGHGTCDPTTSVCTCQNGWGSPTDKGRFKAADCSARMCPFGKAWSDLPTGADTAHADAECSEMGHCDSMTGKCRCFQGFEGNACQRNSCPNSCYGHGQCVSQKYAAGMSNAVPIGPNLEYGGFEETVTWDEDMIHGCVCDSSWAVGLASGESQEAEFFGPDCSMRRCPSGDDPLTLLVDETDCEGINNGLAGNKCHIDCSRRGTCDYTSGECTCFAGFYGDNCRKKAKHITSNRGRIYYAGSSTDAVFAGTS